MDDFGNNAECEVSDRAEDHGWQDCKECIVVSSSTSKLAEWILRSPYKHLEERSLNESRLHPKQHP